MFFIGLTIGFVLGAAWMVGARIVVKMHRDNVVAANSASANKPMPKLPPDIVESDNACDYCVNRSTCAKRGPVNCQSMSRFRGRQLRQ